MKPRPCSLLALACASLLRAADTYTIAVTPKGSTHEHWKTVHPGAIKAQRELKARGVNVARANQALGACHFNRGACQSKISPCATNQSACKFHRGLCQHRLRPVQTERGMCQFLQGACQSGRGCVRVAPWSVSIKPWDVSNPLFSRYSGKTGRLAPFRPLLPISGEGLRMQGAAVPTIHRIFCLSPWPPCIGWTFCSLGIARTSTTLPSAARLSVCARGRAGPVPPFAPRLICWKPEP